MLLHIRSCIALDGISIRYIFPITTKSFQATKESFVRTTTHVLNESAIIFDVFDSVY